MEGRTYRYFTGKPLYPFGYGLSYTRFVYNSLILGNRTISAGQSQTVRVVVKNVGTVTGDEVRYITLRSLYPDIKAIVSHLPTVYLKEEHGGTMY